MKRLVCIIVYCISFLCCCISALAQSNKGTEFWTAYMAHINDAGSQMSLYISADAATTYRVEMADGTLIQTAQIPANTAITVAIPATAYLGNNEYSAGPGNKKGIHITSTLPIAVYAHIYASNVSGATLLLPVNALNKDYYSINYTQISNQEPAFSTFAVIATENGTLVNITPTANVVSRIGTTNTITHPAGQLYQISLDKGDVYQATAPSGTDFTGTRIISVSGGTGDCKKIAVFSGSSKIRIGSSATNSSDNLFQQVYPTAVWGKNFVTAPLKGRAYDIFRIIYSDPSANVTINGVPITPNNTAGNIAYYQYNVINENNLNSVRVISSDKPIQVVQYAVTQNNGINASGSPINAPEAAGDPEMIFLPPIEQGLKNITLYSPGEFRISDNSHYINVIIPSAAKSTFVLDNISMASAFTDIPNSIYSYAQLNVTEGQQHTISAAQNFSAIAYGFGPAESYGYAAGTNLLNLNEFITLSGISSSSSQLLGCTDVPYYLQLTVPYEPTKIVWEPADGGPNPTFPNAPVYYKRDLQTDGTYLYTYRYYRTVKFAAGNYTATATVTLPLVGANNCAAEKIIEFNFNIAEFPIAKFTPPVNNCAGSTLQFTDESDPAGSTITQWLWDFGDAANSTTTNPNYLSSKNPQHTYTSGGNYVVKLTVVNQNGCQSPVFSGTVHINKNPEAKFIFTSPDCLGREVTFTDQSAANEGTITEWKWTFDDGTSETRTTNTAFTHVFNDTRTYNVALQVTTSLGCVSTKTLQVTVHPVPVVSFALPDACIQNAAMFTSTSTIADGTEAGFTYEWDFGDPNATAANNKAFGKQVSHRYTQVRGIDNPYKVKLKITSIYGCITELTQDFVVNGSQPKAVFAPLAPICSDNDLVLESQSYVVDVGNITKYVIYYDYDGDRTNMEVYDKNNLPIPANSKFVHRYPTFNAPASKQYHLYIEVYSGGVDCKDIYSTYVTVNANPQIILTHAPTICQENLPIQFGEDKGIYSGTGVFTGAGVSATGEFTPKLAGPGTHEITYTFTSDGTGCTYQEKFNILVYPTPLVTGKRDWTANQGEQFRIDPLVLSLNGTALTYKWTPHAGLDRDDVMNPLVTSITDTKYVLTVTSANNCTATATFNILVRGTPVTYNTFTPNGDRYNDTWTIKNMEAYPKATVDVFNRNGAKVFNSIGYPIPWNGRYNGQDLPAGTYYYIIDLKNGKPALSGSVTIIR